MNETTISLPPLPIKLHTSKTLFLSMLTLHFLLICLKNSVVGLQHMNPIGANFGLWLG